MKINYDTVANAVYLNVGAGNITKTLKLANKLNVDIDDSNNIIGIEFLDASSQEDFIQNLKNNVDRGIPVEINSITPQVV